ncbi:hypothetical protein ANRL3_02835 [Anaerolineae bacterium]|nr:hypothetical protein ANRL3_02835 [Anaerolineae bacterium]
MTYDLDLLVESAVVSGQLAAGMSLAVIAARSSLGTRAITVMSHATAPRTAMRKSPEWTRDEDAFLTANLGILSESAIGAHLGRTPGGVHLRWKRDLRLTAPSNRSNELTCEQAACGLGIESKSLAKLIERGVLPGRKLPFDNRVMRVIERAALLRFIVNPLNWVYFNPVKVGRPPARLRRTKKYDAAFWKYVGRLVALKRARWNDEWWSIGRVARYHGVDTRVINRAIHLKYLPAVDYGNWWILKSHATDPRVRFYKGKGKPGCVKSDWTPRADAFLLRARADGLTVRVIARMMKKSHNQVTFRLTILKKERIVHAGTPR